MINVSAPSGPYIYFPFTRAFCFFWDPLASENPTQHDGVFILIKTAVPRFVQPETKPWESIIPNQFWSGFAAVTAWV